MKKTLTILTYIICVHFTSAQNVGVGTTVPAVPLHINRNTDELLRLQGIHPYMQLNNNGVAIGYVQAYGLDLLVGTNPGNAAGAIKFYNNTIPNMTILPNGNVGIGTTIPYAPLSFPNVLGNKISLWNADATHDFGIGIASGAMRLYTAGQDRISFGWGNASSFTERATLFTGNGYLGLNATDPQTQLHINKDAEALRISGNGSYLSFYNGSSYRGYLWSKEPNNIELATAVGNTTGSLSLGVQGNPHLTVQNDGRVKVGALGCTLLAQGDLPKLSVQGPLGFKKNYGDQSGEWAIRYGSPTVGNPDGLVFCFNGGNYKAFIDEFDGAWRAPSDARLKEDFKNYKYVLDGIKKLNVLTYHYKSDKTGHRCFGLVAQNLKQYFPELVSGDEKNKDEYLSIAYDKTGVLAIKAIQEQQVIIEEQQKKIDELERRLSILENKLR